MAMRLRLILCLLLCLALPLNGLAALAMPAEPCPMPAQAHEALIQAGTDCCDAQKSAQLGSKVCKNGQQCQSSSLLQVTVDKPALVTPGVPSPPRYSDFIPSPTPEGLWRPPRA